MLTDINPKLPMRNKAITKDFYLNKLNFQKFGSTDYNGYLMVQKENLIQKKITGRCISALTI